jgi:hypothetical protein
MQNANETIEQLNVLKNTMEDMSVYLDKLIEGCEALPGDFETGKKAQALENMTQIMEGLEYYLKLLVPITQLLLVDENEQLGDISISLLKQNMQRTFVDICEAAENEDFSLIADLVEYDLLVHLNSAQNLLTMLQQLFGERVG